MKYIAFILTVFLISCNGMNDKPAAIPADKPLKQVVYKDEPCDTNFDAFFKKFQSDSVFQRHHVKFPLKNTFLNSEGNYEVLREDITILKYEFLDFTSDNEAATMENGAFTIHIEKEKDSVFYQVRGIDNGIHTDIKFALIEGCWYLVAIEDSST